MLIRFISLFFLIPLFFVHTSDAKTKEEVNVEKAENSNQKSIEETERLIYDKARRFVVMISTSAHLTADSWGGNASSWKGTGFIINKEKGLILTNKHVVGELSVASYEVKFHDGTTEKAEYAYVDPIYDFAILRVNPEKIPITCAQAEIDKEPLSINESIYSIGNSAGDEFSVHKGIVFSIYENVGPFSEQSFKFSGITVGGASGSPVIGVNHKVKGILYGGKFVSGAGLPMMYITRILKQVEDGVDVKRFSVGLILTYNQATKAMEAGLFSKAEYDEYKKTFPMGGDKIVTVTTRLVNTKGLDIFQPGDIIYKVNNKMVGPNLLLIDECIDEFGNASKDLPFTIFRDGKLIEVKLTPYAMAVDADFDFIYFAGSIWSDVSEKIKLKTGISEGVFILKIDESSPFKGIMGDTYGTQSILVESIDGKVIKNLKDLEKVIPDILKKKNFMMRYTNENGNRQEFNYENINDHLPRFAIVPYSAKFDSPKIYKRDLKTKEWDTKTFTGEK